jgi:hypothetical protein
MVGSRFDKELREESGEISGNSKLVSFFYTLMRDHILPADIMKLVKEDHDTPVCYDPDNKKFTYTNGWLAEMAAWVVLQLSDKVQRFMLWRKTDHQSIPENYRAVIVQQECKEFGLTVGIQGYGTCNTNGDDPPILLEFVEDEGLILTVWAEINQEDPTHRIRLDKALHTARWEEEGDESRL